MYKKLKAPLIVQIELTSKCTNQCVHCYNFWRGEYQKPKSLSIDQSKILTEELSKNKIFHVVLTGGEPFLNKEVLYSFIESLISKNITIGINSNLTTVSEKDAKHLKQLGIRSVLTSLMGPNSKIHDKIAQRKGAFEETVNGIKTLKKHNVPVNVNMVVSQKNKSYVKETARFTKSLGLKNFYSTRVSCPGNCKNFSDFSLNIKEFRKYLKDLYEVGQEENMYVNVLESYPLCSIKNVNKFRNFTNRKCLAGISSLTIGSDGKVRPCSHLDIKYGNIFEEGLKKIWDKMKPWREGNFIPEFCRSCELLGLCGGGCRMEAKMKNRALNSIDPYVSKNDIGYVMSKVNSKKKIKQKKMPKYFKLNPNIRLRRENFGGTAFLKAKFACYLNKYGFQLLTLLEKEKIYTVKKIKDCLCKKNVKIKKFVQYLFDREVIILHKK